MDVYCFKINDVEVVSKVTIDISNLETNKRRRLKEIKIERIEKEVKDVIRVDFNKTTEMGNLVN